MPYNAFAMRVVRALLLAYTTRFRLPDVTVHDICKRGARDDSECANVDTLPLGRQSRVGNRRSQRGADRRWPNSRADIRRDSKHAHRRRSDQ